MNNRAEINQNAAESQIIRPWSSLLIRDFRLLWIASVLTSLAVQIRNVSNLYQVYQLSGSAFMLGLTGFLETLPFIIFGLFAGAVADAFDRKKVLLVTMVLQLIPGVAMALLTRTEAVQVWHIYSLGFLGAFVDVFNWPARAALVPRLVPPGLMMNAVTINSMIIQMSFLVGPALAGVCIDHTGLVMTYSISTLLLVPAIASILSLRSGGKIEGRKRQVNLRSIIEGVEFIWIQRIILSLFLLDFGVTLVGFYRPILPIFAADVFNMGASGLGLLYAAPSAGSLLGSMTLLMAGDIKHKGIAVVMAAVGFAASLALLGVSHWFWLAVAAVIILGITDSISVAIRRTVVQLLAPNEMLGRANSLITVFAQTTNGLGALLAGAAAQFIGAPNALLVGSGLCFLMIMATCVAIPQLWRYRSD
ncbi:MAG TPA: MFS transporter [Candidatus Binatia bacterium]|nr:MFS transporter [Candidatus Binatia bacterium]